MFDRCIRNLEYDVLAVATEVRKSMRLRQNRHNLSVAERSAIASVLRLDVGFNSSDKNYGPVLYSRELSREQCRLHLEDAGKGTYRKIVDETKGDILNGILLTLRSLLCRFKDIGDSWA